MKLISHRGNINGPVIECENNPKYIEKAIELGFDVEIDIRIDDETGLFWSGHDKPQYKIDWWWLSKYIDHLWIHCKNIESLHFFSTISEDECTCNYFWHQEDDYTITGKNIIWSYPKMKYTSNTIIVLPEINFSWDMINDQCYWDSLKNVNCYGICSDYVGKLK